MEVQRLVNAAGIITLGSQVVQVGSPLAGQRARIRPDGQVMHVITRDGLLWRTLPCPIPPASGTGCRASASPGQTRCRNPACPSSGRSPAAAASRSAASASRSASATPARPSPSNSAHDPAGHRPARRARHHDSPHRQRRDHQVQGLRHPAARMIKSPPPSASHPTSWRPSPLAPAGQLHRAGPACSTMAAQGSAGH
jgi:hypothetical protein